MTTRKSIRLVSILFAALSGAEWAVSAEITVNVVGQNGEPVANIAVFVEQAGAIANDSHVPKSATMDQRDIRFVPHILVVEKGAAVDFPNSDIVAHHVYSFSRPNNFVLPLYKGSPAAPVVFEHDGIVTLGCNIHDGMLGYVAVVDTNVFGLTDESGSISLALDDSAEEYLFSIWSPRIRDSKEPLSKSLSALPEDGVTFHLQKSLRPAHEDQSESVQWDEYE